MAGRSTPPLFELLRGDDPQKPRRTVALAPKPVDATPPPPAPAPAAPATSTPPAVAAPAAAPAPSASPASAPAPSRTPSPTTSPAREMSFSPTVVYAAGAVMLVAVVVAWSAGVWFGESRAERQYYSSLEQASISDPTLADPARPGTAPSDSARAGPPPPNADNPAPPGSPAIRSGGVRVLLAGGAAIGDPRQPGHNYLHLASAVPASQAQSAVNYLASRGFQAVAVPTVDRRGRPNNDSGSYDLFSLLPIPSAEYSARRAEREAHQALARRLGRDWLNRPEGNINFDSTQWRKHDG